MRYAILADDMNHTCLYLIEASNSELAVQHFLADEWHDEPEENRDEAAAKASYLRFELHEVKGQISGILGVAYPIFCSDDQIYDIEPPRLEKYLAQRHAQLGSIYLANERWDEAVAEYLKVSKLNASVLSADTVNAGLAEAYIGQGNTHAAIEIYKTALAQSDPENNSDYDDALKSLAKIYRSLGDHATALPYYERYFELNLSESARENFDSEPISEYEQDIIDYIAAHRPKIQD